MSGCCAGPASFDGASAAYRRVLGVVIAINATMFAVELASGLGAGSQALLADALDFLGDSATYGLSLAVIGSAAVVRARAALVKGAALALFGVGVLGATAYRVFVPGVPDGAVMGGVGLLALAANLASALLLLRWRAGDANVRSVWLCSRNDAIGNLAVVLAASGVLGLEAGWPDLLVAAAMAGLFLATALGIVRQARAEIASARDGLPAPPLGTPPGAAPARADQAE